MAAKNLEILRGLAQAAADSYDGAYDADGNAIEFGLRREDKDQYKRNMMDGFGVRFAHDKATIARSCLKKYTHEHSSQTRWNSVLAISLRG